MRCLECHFCEALTLLTADQSVSSGKTVDCIVITEGGLRPHNYSIYYLSLRDRLLTSDIRPKPVWSVPDHQKVKTIVVFWLFFLNTFVTLVHFNSFAHIWQTKEAGTSWSNFKHSKIVYWYTQTLLVKRNVFISRAESFSDATAAKSYSVQVKVVQWRTAV